MATQVLIVGETQQGKSTLISRISNYAKASRIDIGIGNGNTSCTKCVGVYAISAAPRAYCLLDRNGSKIRGKSFSNMIDLDSDDVSIAPEDPNPDPVVDYLLIDTPGLDDSSGNDMDIMASIMGRISELEHLNAIVYVRGVEKNFGDTFQSFFKYLQDSMPALCNALILVHTMYTVGRVERAMGRGEDLAERRRQQFRQIMKIDLQHIFMDNRPDVGCPFAEMQSLNQCTQLLRLLGDQRSLSVSRFRLLKTPHMANVDTRVVVELLNLKSRLTEKWDKAMEKAAESTRNTMMSVGRAQRKRRELQEVRDELNDLNTDDEINLGQRAVSKDYAFFKNAVFKGEFWLDEERVEFHSPCEITRVDTSTSGKSEWREVQRSAGYWSAKIGAPILRSINGTATFYTTNKRKHEREIGFLSRTIKTKEQDLADEEEMLQHLNVNSGRSRDASVEELAAKIEACTAVTEKVQQRDLDLSLWPNLKHFYADKAAPNQALNFKEFVRVYDAGLANDMYL